MMTDFACHHLFRTCRRWDCAHLSKSCLHKQDYDFVTYFLTEKCLLKPEIYMNLSREERGRFVDAFNMMCRYGIGYGVATGFATEEERDGVATFEAIIGSVPGGASGKQPIMPRTAHDSVQFFVRHRSNQCGSAIMTLFLQTKRTATL